eukprot:GDKJ01051732.1.p2 GENE.GDKJ01051732.1~~GDKJ01051732.1.p2  ORF type:complete len:144 (-),score=38.30 GDKJ01051732.1:97-528(-)
MRLLSSDFQVQDVTVSEFVRCLQTMSQCGLVEIVSARAVGDVKGEQLLGDEDEVEVVRTEAETANEVIGAGARKLAKSKQDSSVAALTANHDMKLMVLRQAEEFALQSAIGVFAIKLGCVEETNLRAVLREDTEIPRVPLLHD